MYADDQREILFGRTELDAMIVRLGGVECAAGEEEEFTSLPDLDGFFTDDNPYGLNEGNGLTAAGEGTMRFDISAYAGQEIRLRLRYFTYRGGPGTGFTPNRLR